jgi:hypothetical protein
MMRRCVAGQIFFMSVPFMTNTKVAPVSATACVGSIAGCLGCTTGAHISCHHNIFVVTTVLSLSLMAKLWVEYKVGVELNEFKNHLMFT